MESIRTGVIDTKEILVTSDGSIKIFDNRKEIMTLSFAEAAKFTRLLLKSMAYISLENNKAMNEIPNAIGEIKQATKIIQESTDRFEKLLNEQRVNGERCTVG